MTFPASRIALQKGLEQAQADGNNLRYTANAVATKMAAGNVLASDILVLLDNLIAYKTEFTALAGITGMDAYAQAQLGQTIGTDFTAMLTAITNCGAWVVTNFPKDPSGYLLAEKFAGDGSRAPRAFTPTDTAGLVTLLQALAATIS